MSEQKEPATDKRWINGTLQRRNFSSCGSQEPSKAVPCEIAGGDFTAEQKQITVKEIMRPEIWRAYLTLDCSDQTEMTWVALEKKKKRLWVSYCGLNAGNGISRLISFSSSQKTKHETILQSSRGKYLWKPQRSERKRRRWGTEALIWAWRQMFHVPMCY